MSDMKNAPGMLQKALNELSEGLETSPPAGLTQIAAGGKVSTIPELIAEIQGYAAVYRAAEEANLAWDKAILAREAIAPKANARFVEIRAALKAALGKRNPELVTFGMTPEQVPTPLTVEQKVAQAAKARATRAARHTMGPKQKKAIKGQVPQAAEQTPAVA